MDDLNEEKISATQNGRPKKPIRAKFDSMLEPRIIQALGESARLSGETRPDWLNRVLREKFGMDKWSKKLEKIIGGKLYSTSTATELASWDNGLGNGDFDNCCETLYRKNNGEFFIYGTGGARSKYRNSDDFGNSYSGGENIFPVSEQEAREWAEAKCSVREYQEIFGPVGE